MYIKINKKNPLAKEQAISASELKHIACIIVASKEQEDMEKDFYQTILNIQSDIIYVKSREEANLLVASNQGFVITDEIYLWKIHFTLIFAYKEKNTHFLSALLNIVAIFNGYIVSVLSVEL